MPSRSSARQPPPLHLSGARYAEDGMLEVDSSALQNAHCVLWLLTGSFLSVGSNCGGERAAAMYTLIGSAKPDLNAMGV